MTHLLSVVSGDDQVISLNLKVRVILRNAHDVEKKPDDEHVPLLRDHGIECTLDSMCYLTLPSMYFQSAPSHVSVRLYEFSITDTTG